MPENPEADWARQYRSASAAPRDRAGCPSSDVLAQAAIDRSSIDRNLTEHLARCADCTDEWRAIASETLGSSAPRRTAWWGALAAALAVGVLGLGLYAARQATTATSVVRDASSRGWPGPLRSDQTATRDQCVLRWPPAPGAVGYDLEIAREDLSPLHRASGLTATEYRVPPDRLAALPAGAVIVWRIEAISSDGTRTSSPLQRVHLP